MRAASITLEAIAAVHVTNPSIPSSPPAIPGLGWRLALYNLVVVLALPLIIVAFALHALVNRRVRAGHAYRLGLRLPPRSRGSVVWVHAVCAGEVGSVKRLVEMILAAGHYAVYLSTSTASGFAAAQRAFGKAVTMFYFPVDFRFAIRRFLDAIRPAAVIIAEVEIWPNFLALSYCRAIPVFLVNGRIGPKERSAYSRLRWFFAPFFSAYRTLFAQSEGDRERMVEIGMPAQSIVVTGNLKCDASFRVDPTRESSISGLIPAGRKIIVAGSTHAPEERCILEAVRSLHAGPIFLIVAPRNVGRAAEIRKLCVEQGFAASLVSEVIEHDVASPCDVLVVDTVGDLPSLYQSADVVIMGGSFCPNVGGHNFLEPLYFAKPVIVGPWMQNFADNERLFLAKGGLCKIDGCDQLGRTLEQLIQDEELRRAIGSTGQELLAASRGGSDETYARIFEASGFIDVARSGLPCPSKGEQPVEEG